MGKDSAGLSFRASGDSAPVFPGVAPLESQEDAGWIHTASSAFRL